MIIGALVLNRWSLCVSFGFVICAESERGGEHERSVNANGVHSIQPFPVAGVGRLHRDARSPGLFGKSD